MQTLFVIAAVALGGPLPGAEVGPEQFARLIKDLYAPIRDVSFVFEGEIGPVGPDGRFEDRGGQFPILFQDAYAYRSDDSVLLDNYVRNKSVLSYLLSSTSALLFRYAAWARAESMVSRNRRGSFEKASP